MMGEYTPEDVVRYWKAQNIQTEADLDAVVNGQAVTLAYNTNKIEYPEVTFHDTREVFEHGRVIGYTGDTRTLFAIQDAKNAWELFLRSFGNRRILNASLVREFHRELTTGTYNARRYARGERPGQYKIGDYVTGRGEVGALPEDVPEEMEELLADLQEIPAGAELTAAALFHAKFENIHPFADGNGRTGRLAMNYLLVLHDYPVITIHEGDRAAYMHALEIWDQRQELKPLRDFLEEQMVKTWETTLRRHEKDF